MLINYNSIYKNNETIIFYIFSKLCVLLFFTLFILFKNFIRLACLSIRKEIIYINKNNAMRHHFKGISKFPNAVQLPVEIIVTKAINW